MQFVRSGHGRVCAHERLQSVCDAVRRSADRLRPHRALPDHVDPRTGDLLSARDDGRSSDRLSRDMPATLHDIPLAIPACAYDASGLVQFVLALAVVALRAGGRQPTGGHRGSGHGDTGLLGAICFELHVTRAVPDGRPVSVLCHSGGHVSAGRPLGRKRSRAGSRRFSPNVAAADDAARHPNAGFPGTDTFTGQFGHGTFA